MPWIATGELRQKTGMLIDVFTSNKDKTTLRAAIDNVLVQMMDNELDYLVESQLKNVVVTIKVELNRE